MIGAVAGLIAAVVAVCTLLYQVFGDKDGKDDTASPPAGSRQAESAGPVGVAPSGSGPFDVVLTGSGIDLDVIPPRAFTDFSLAADAYGTDQLIAYPSGAGIAKWTGAAAPSRAECVAAVNSAPLDSAPITGGSRFCLVTNNERHYAYLEFTQPADNGFQLRATIWPGA
jgi:hypothetical protein